MHAKLNKKKWVRYRTRIVSKKESISKLSLRNGF